MEKLRCGFNAHGKEKKNTKKCHRMKNLRRRRESGTLSDGKNSHCSCMTMINSKPKKKTELKLKANFFCNEYHFQKDFPETVFLLLHPIHINFFGKKFPWMLYI